MIKRLLLLVICVSALASTGNAQNIRLVDREPFETILLGLIDFDSISASPLPGTLFDARIPFRGMIANTYFLGQIPFAKVSGGKVYARNYGRPADPLKEAGSRGGLSSLYVATVSTHNRDAFLISRVFESGIAKRPESMGFGAIALRFSNRQFVFGFDLKSISKVPVVRPTVQVRFFTEGGEQVGAPVLLTEFGTYTFLTPDQSRSVKGIEITNAGVVPFGIDSIVFELPLFLG